MALPLTASRRTAGLLRLAVYGALLFFTWLMLLITSQYIPARPDVAFLRVKQDVAGRGYYQLAFFTHVYSSIFVLLTGILQFPPMIRKRFPVLHRWSGRVYVGLILVLAGPSGLLMGYYGNGGWVAQAAFCLLALLWLLFTFLGYRAARKGNFDAHRRWMYRSYALTLSAISLRLWKWVLVLLFAPKPMEVYRLVAWLGWVGNLLVAEWIIYYSFRKSKSEIKKNLTIPI
ncbi:DUF2306 domain-containing protein [Taibaiella koreensis]|uniref:DUF2306 domain-containing protein n=1 Tax=Taibaiella koreensis TaxID=1268548 RepID=UPI000E59BC96|nr:DUF2306 domain-containing protein [Taibaiella koreensis]